MTLAAPSADPRLPRAGEAVRVRAPGRLHLGFLDPGATLGRRFGSIGLVIDGFETTVDIGPATVGRVSRAGAVDDAAGDAELARAVAHLAALRERTGHRAPLHLHLARWLPAHAGFGSGTQLALAVGRAFAHWHGLDLSVTTLARWLGRGLRSGVGIAGFEHGGLLLDGGPAPGGEAAPLLARLPFPPAWRCVVVLDARHRGLSGVREKEAIATLPPLPQAAAADICHQVLMRLLPGAASADFAPFARGLSHLQHVLGAHFAPAQQGSAYTSAGVGRLLEWIASQGGATAAVPAGTGQSSWGPTGFAIVESQAQAEALCAAARAAGAVDAGLELRIVGARNHGARIEAAPASFTAAESQA